MRRALLIASAALAILATGAASAAAASPEVGRCLAVAGVTEGTKTVYSGGYSNASCTKAAPAHNGKYEWNPGPGAENRIEGYSEGPLKLETAGGAKIICVQGQVFGEYTGPKTESLWNAFSQCKDGDGKACTTLATEASEEHEPPHEGVIESATETGELGIVPGLKPLPGWDVKAAKNPFIFAFECGSTLGLGTKYFIEGSYIDTVKKAANKMAGANVQIYKETGGKQEPAAFVGGTPDTLTVKIETGLEITTEPIGYSSKEESESYELVEYRTKG